MTHGSAGPYGLDATCPYRIGRHLSRGRLPDVRTSRHADRPSQPCGSGRQRCRCVAIGRARAAEFNYRLAHDLPPGHPLNVRTVEACSRIREATGGRIDIKVFAESQLGSDIVSLGQVRTGEIEFFSVPGLILSSAVPAASINGVGFAFNGYSPGVAPRWTASSA